VKGPALLSVAQPASEFASLFAAARAAGARIGWLEPGPEPGAAPHGAPALDAGADKEVAVGDGRVRSVKRVGGPAVLRDLLREHFLGYLAVLVAGSEGSPRLVASEERFAIAEGGRVGRWLSADQLLAELARPRRRS